MGGTFEATLDVTALGKILNKLGAKPADLTPVMEVVAEQLVAAVSDEFDSQGRGKWPPLKESTLRGRRGGHEDMGVGTQRHSDAQAAYYESAGRGEAPEQSAEHAGRAAQRGMILQDTGALAGSIHGESGADFALATTDKFYAVFHVSDAARTIIPLRNFFDVPDDVFETAAITILGAIAE